MKSTTDHPDEYPNHGEDPDRLGTTATKADTTADTKKLKDCSASILAAYHRTKMSGEALWQDFITDFDCKPSERVAGRRSLSIETSRRNAVSLWTPKACRHPSKPSYISYIGPPTLEESLNFNTKVLMSPATPIRTSQSLLKTQLTPTYPSSPLP